MTMILVIQNDEDDVHHGDGYMLTSRGLTVFTDSGGWLATPDELYAAVRFKDAVSGAMQEAKRA